MDKDYPSSVNEPLYYSSSSYEFTIAPLKIGKVKLAPGSVWPPNGAHSAVQGSKVVGSPGSGATRPGFEPHLCCLASLVILGKLLLAPACLSLSILKIKYVFLGAVGELSD